MLAANTYAGNCNNVACRRHVGPQEGFRQKLGGSWVVWCRNCVPDGPVPASESMRACVPAEVRVVSQVRANLYPGKCNHPACRRDVAPNEGFITKVAGRWVTWCKEHCPERITPAAAPPPPERKLTADGRVITPYEPDNLDLVRSFPGAYFDRDANPKCWRVSLSQSDRQRVLEIADRLGLAVAPELRKVVVTEEAKNATNAGLYAFQVTGVNWLSLQQNALLGDEMGLGKTIQGLVACPDPREQRVLVVCPSGLRYNWRDEAAIWRPDYRTFVVEGSADFRTPQKGEIVIVSFDCLPDFLLEPKRQKGQHWKVRANLVKLHHELLRTQHPDLCECLVIVDEVHKCKSQDALRSVKVRTLSNICERVWGLTGTPLLNRALELKGVLENLNLFNRAFGNAAGEFAFPNMMRLFNARKEYVRGARREVLVWGEPTPEVPERLRRVMLARKRAEVLPDLPSKVYTDVLVSLKDLPNGGRIQKKLDSLWEEWGTLMTVKEELPPFSSFSEVRAQLAEACVPAMLEYVENCEDQDTRLVVASAHLAPLDALLTRPGWAVISGATDAEDRQAIATAQRKGELNVGCSITAAGVGLTLTGAYKMLFVDLDWVPANNWQMEDRICRIGQTANKCEIIRFVVDHPLVRHIHKLLAAKIALIEKAVNAKAVAHVPAASAAVTGGESEEEYQARMERARQAEEDFARQQAEEEERQAKERAKGKALVVREREQARANGSGRVIHPLTPERAEAVRRAFNYMLSVCDGALAKDGQGFNKPDAVVAHCILPCGLETQEELEAAYWMLTRYKRQLHKREPLLFI